MRRIGLANATRGMSLGDRIEVADGWWNRLRGLIGRPPLRRGEGLVLVPTRAVHMFWMKQSLDVAFLDGRGRVVATYPGLAPGQRTRWHREAERAVELPPGTLVESGTQIGDEVHETLPAGRGSTRSPVAAGVEE